MRRQRSCLLILKKVSGLLPKIGLYSNLLNKDEDDFNNILVGAKQVKPETQAFQGEAKENKINSDEKEDKKNFSEKFFNYKTLTTAPKEKKASSVIPKFLSNKSQRQVKRIGWKRATSVTSIWRWKTRI